MTTPKLRIADDAGKALPKYLDMTEARLRTISCPSDKARVMVYHRKIGGLVYAVTRGGSRAFYWVGRVKGQGKPVYFLIGSHTDVSLADAERRARTIGANAANGIDPREVRDQRRADDRAKITVQELWDTYREEQLVAKGRASTLRSDDSRYKLHLSVWSRKSIQSITREDVAELHRTLTVKKTPNTADKAVKLLRRMLTFARINPNPAMGNAVEFHGDQKKDSFLSVEQIARLNDALDNADNQVMADAIRFALLTGARKANICGARWSQIQLDQGLWIVPQGLSKNKDTMAIPLTSDALALLQRRREANQKWLERRANRYKLAEVEKTDLVFPGDGPDKPITDVNTTWRAVRKAAGLADFRFHDLRHTLASHMAMSGATAFEIAQQLGHADLASTARYSHLMKGAARPRTEAAQAAMFGRKQPEAGKITKGVNDTM